MTTDDERRRVARNIRENYIRGGMGCRTASTYNIALAVGIVPEMLVEDIELWNRLADLIDPDTTSDTTKSAEDTTKASTSSDTAPTSSDATATHTDATATCDPTGRGIDSIYDWCFERIEGADGDEDELYCSIMSAIEGHRHPERVTARTARPVDREALLALADGILDAVRNSRGIGIEGEFAECMRKLSRDIRELCGEEAQ